jgi:lysyl-tRNA synthetase class 2
MILEIEFRRGGVYRYLEVPELLYRRLMASQSKGAFFNSGIADRFQAVRLDDEGA